MVKPLSMCDWEAEEYAEYLLWVEAEKVRARARSGPESLNVPGTSWITAGARREAAEA